MAGWVNYSLPLCSKKKDKTVYIKDRSADIKDKSADIKDKSADFKDKSADFKDKSADFKKKKRTKPFMWIESNDFFTLNA